MGITEVVSAARSPWQNAYVERVIGSICRECLDYIVIINERHLRRVLVCGLLPPQPHASRTRQGLSGPSPGHATQERQSSRHPASEGLASPQRTSRRLIRP